MGVRIIGVPLYRGLNYIFEYTGGGGSEVHHLMANLHSKIFHSEKFNEIGNDSRAGERLAQLSTNFFLIQ